MLKLKLFRSIQGGLGNVAGDQLKAASDLGVPVIAIGSLYQQDYFVNLLIKMDLKEADYPYNHPGQYARFLPLRTGWRMAALGNCTAWAFRDGSAW